MFTSHNISTIRVRLNRYLLFNLLSIGMLLLMFSPGLIAGDAGNLAARQIINKLQKGGYILYIRHGATDHSQQDKDISDLRKCELQRNLSEKGKEESRILGQALKKLNIKIDGVFTSPYCRCIDTARIAFGRYDIVQDLQATFVIKKSESLRLAKVLKSKLSRIPKPGFNTVLIGHTANLREAAKIWPKPEGVAHVFKPLGSGKYEHLGRITPTQWGPLANIQK